MLFPSALQRRTDGLTAAVETGHFLYRQVTVRAHALRPPLLAEPIRKPAQKPSLGLCAAAKPLKRRLNTANRQAEEGV